MITIEQAKQNEHAILQDLNHEVFLDNAQYDADIILDWAHSAVAATYFKDLIRDEESVCLIAKDDTKPVGYIAASPKHFSYRHSTYIEINDMGVIPEYRSQGIGQQLIAACLAWAKERGFQKAYVNAYAANTRGIAFYEKNGFEILDVSLERTID